ncbi:hypothetical protein H7K24_00255 [Mycobacterium fragae]|uniref:hypothetical protein n=1 Tax=Mycobacterium fragae TaxID=1260918 RepID=UPI00111C4E6E|nr:hypothetical protein [Mycobacterium fragae]MCV7398589.1 hypothetical protein [Mycobacterium fragae]
MSLPAFVADLLTPQDLDALVFPDSMGGYMRGTNVRRRWWSRAVAAAELFPEDRNEHCRGVKGGMRVQALRAAPHGCIPSDPGRRQHQSASEMPGHEFAGLMLDRHGHLYGSDVEAVGVAINDLLTRNLGKMWARRGLARIPALSCEPQASH